MKFRLQTLALIALSLSLVSPVWAQAPAGRTQSADYVVAIVNSEPITNSEVRAAMARVREQLKVQGKPEPAAEELRNGVLERLISDRAQLQLARSIGLQVDDSTVDVAEQGLARQNQVSLEALRQRMEQQGISTATLRNQLRDQLVLQRLREREVESRVRVSEQDVDRALAEQQAANTDPLAQELNLAQLLIAVPERADETLTAQLQAQAQALLVRVRAGEDFAALVKQYSGADRSNGGQFGIRRADRYPPSFVEATQNVAVGGTAELVRSGAGFHILQVVERKVLPNLAKAVTQTRARHILLRTSAELSPFEATTRLAALRERIVSGKTDFAAAARENSQDSSATQGGDLGWVSPGMFVPEFEEVMNRLKEEEISTPTVSRFGVHLIQTLARRRVELNPREVRELVRSQLRDAKLGQAYADWVAEVRERAYVELREAPQ
jgi:peptidyl-prolyl cis-trans isomerase SurA